MRVEKAAWSCKCNVQSQDILVVNAQERLFLTALWVRACCTSTCTSSRSHTCWCSPRGARDASRFKSKVQQKGKTNEANKPLETKAQIIVRNSQCMTVTGGRSVPLTITERRGNECFPWYICMQNHHRHRKQPFYQLQQQAPWRVGWGNAPHSFCDSIANLAINFSLW